MPWNPTPEQASCYVCGRRLVPPPRERRTPIRRRAERPRRRRAISEASPAQRAKVKGRPCIVCGAVESEYVAIDPAHVAKRSQGGCDHEDCVVPLCRTFDGGCHRPFDDGELDLLRVVADRWPAERVEVQHALEHLRPVQLLERLANTRTQWSEAA